MDSTVPPKPLHGHLFSYLVYEPMSAPPPTRELSTPCTPAAIRAVNHHSHRGSHVGGRTSSNSPDPLLSADPVLARRAGLEWA